MKRAVWLALAAGALYVYAWWRAVRDDIDRIGTWWRE